MPTLAISDPDDPQIADYRNVPDPTLLRERGLFVAEGRLVVRALLEAPNYRVRSLLVTPPAHDGLRDVLDSHPGLPVFLADLPVLTGIVGFNIHRGCLALGERPAGPADPLAEAAGSPLIVIVERLANADNMGAVFRNARAFGVGCVLLSPGCCDPLYRKAIRVSIGATLRVPWGVVDDWPSGLHRVREAGYEIVALTPRDGADDLRQCATASTGRTALLLGHEGDGLSDEAIGQARRLARIAMAPGVDSVNVAAAAGIALHAYFR